MEKTDERYVDYLEFMIEGLQEACGPAGDDVYKRLHAEYIEANY